MFNALLSFHIFTFTEESLLNILVQKVSLWHRVSKCFMSKKKNTELRYSAIKVVAHCDMHTFAAC